MEGTPAEIEQAVERTGAKYIADMQAMYRTVSEDYHRLYEAQLAAKDEMIAELRRRAEVAERALALPAAPGSTGGEPTANPRPEPPAGFWARLRQVFGEGAR